MILLKLWEHWLKQTVITGSKFVLTAFIIVYWFMLWNANFAHLSPQPLNRIEWNFQKEYGAQGNIYAYKISASYHAPFCIFIGLSCRDGIVLFSRVPND